MLGLVGSIAYYRYANSSPTPILTSTVFDDARNRWNAAPIDDYDVEIEVKGLQPATYQVEVRKGIARRALRNGRPLTQRRTLGTWSVNGMFATMASDVEHLRRSEQGRAETDTLQLELRAEFDSQWGFPLRYHRLEQVRFGNNRSVSWQVTKFQPAVTEDDHPAETDAETNEHRETSQTRMQQISTEKTSTEQISAQPFSARQISARPLSARETTTS